MERQVVLIRGCKGPEDAYKVVRTPSTLRDTKTDVDNYRFWKRPSYPCISSKHLSLIM